MLLALAWPNHVHHERAHRWFGAMRDEGWATCPVTESGFVRVSSNSRVIPDASTPATAIRILGRIRRVPGHSFWSDDVSACDPDAEAFARVVGYRQVTDAHLLTIAVHHGGVLATFDRSLTALAPRGRPDAVEVIG